MTKSITIRRGSIEEAVAISRQLPEFDNPHNEDVYKTRMRNGSGLILIAEVDQTPAGFKVGYDKFENGSFYTWLGGVLPAYRRMGIARLLALHQEEYARTHGYESIILKTRNRHRNMRLFATASGFDVIEVIPKKQIEENRIVLKKVLQ